MAALGSNSSRTAPAAAQAAPQRSVPPPAATPAPRVAAAERSRETPKTTYEKNRAFGPKPTRPKPLTPAQYRLPKTSTSVNRQGHKLYGEGVPREPLYTGYGSARPIPNPKAPGESLKGTGKGNYQRKNETTV